MPTRNEEYTTIYKSRRAIYEAAQRRTGTQHDLAQKLCSQAQIICEYARILQLEAATKRLVAKSLRFISDHKVTDEHKVVVASTQTEVNIIPAKAGSFG